MLIQLAILAYSGLSFQDTKTILIINYHTFVLQLNNLKAQAYNYVAIISRVVVSERRDCTGLYIAAPH